MPKITHEEARESLLRLHLLIYGGRYKPLEINQTRIAINYIEQQEKVSKLIELKDKLINAYQALLASEHTKSRKLIEKWQEEVIRLLDVIKKLEEGE